MKIDYLRECFELDEIKGILIWRVRPISHFATDRTMRMVNTANAGNVAGYFSEDKNRSVLSMGGKYYLLHRVIYAMANSIDLDDVPAIIDHIDGNSSNNRTGNLRPATSLQSVYNRAIGISNTSGYIGVRPKGDRWSAEIKILGQLTHLGVFDTKEEAAACYVGAARVLHGEYYREPGSAAAA